MPKQFTLTLDTNSPVSVAHVVIGPPIEREDLYGKLIHQVWNDGEECQGVRVSPSGGIIMASGDTKRVLVTKSGNFVEKGETHLVTPEGNVSEMAEPTIGTEEQGTIGPVDWVLDYNIRSVYQVDIDLVPDDFCIVFPFAMQQKADYDDGIILQGNDGKTYMLLGTPAHGGFVEQAQLASLTGETNDFDEDDDLSELFQ
jgi:hypothetical protein